MPDRDETSPDLSDIAALRYEEAVEQLEAIIDRIESGEIGLEDSIKAYERGVALRRHCERILEQAEQRIEELSARDEEGDDTGGRDAG